MKLVNVYKQWKIVLDLIFKDKVKNSKVWKEHRKLFCAAAAKVEILEEEEEEDAAEG